MSKVKVAGIQASPSEDKRGNLKKVVRLIDQTMTNDGQVDIFCLPELFYQIPLPDNAAQVAEPIPNDLTRKLSDEAKEYGIYFGGKSMVVDPWGVSLATAPQREVSLYAEMDLPYQEEVHRQIPVFDNRRPDLYQ